MFTENEWNELAEILISWALGAYKDRSHSLAEYSNIIKTEEAFIKSVMITGMIIAPEILRKEMKSPKQQEHHKENSVNLDKNDFIQWEVLRRAAMTDDPTVDRARKLVVSPILSCLLLGAKEQHHPLHKALSLVTTATVRENITEAAEMEKAEKRSADYFHQNTIAGPMTGLTRDKLDQIKRSSQGKQPRTDGLSKFILKQLIDTPSLSEHEITKRLKSYSKRDDDDEIGVIIISGQIGSEIIEYETSKGKAAKSKLSNIRGRINTARKKLKINSR
jgi:hypothetical protein